MIVNPTIKYSLARLGLFIVFAVPAFALLPKAMDPLLKIMLALAASAAASFFLLKRMRDQLAGHMSSSATRRAEQKERLRAALAGDDETREAAVTPEHTHVTGDAAVAGDTSVSDAGR